jgi:hypothetical protein
MRAIVLFLAACGHSTTFVPSDGSVDVADVANNLSGCPAFSATVMCPDASSDATCAPTDDTWKKFEGDASASIGCQIETAVAAGDGGCTYEQSTCALVDGEAAWVTTIE